jgi:hypothetical protein
MNIAMIALGVTLAVSPVWAIAGDPRSTPIYEIQKSLKMKTDKERFRAIREGHEGTGMFPDSTLTDQEIRVTLAYLSVL